MLSSLPYSTHSKNKKRAIVEKGFYDLKNA